MRRKAPFRTGLVMRLALLAVLTGLSFLGGRMLAEPLLSPEPATPDPVPMVARSLPAGHAVGGDCHACHRDKAWAATERIRAASRCSACHLPLLTDRTPPPTMEVRWRQSHDLAADTYLNHRIHLTAGVDCATCHRSVDGRAVTAAWCLTCHQSPEPGIRQAVRILTAGGPAAARE